MLKVEEKLAHFRIERSTYISGVGHEREEWNVVEMGLPGEQDLRA